MVVVAICIERVETLVVIPGRWGKENEPVETKKRVSRYAKETMMFNIVNNNEHAVTDSAGFSRRGLH